MTELKPCPFDGYEGVYEYSGEDLPADHEDECWRAVCVHCGCTPNDDATTKKRADAVWNHRPIEDALQARVKELEKTLQEVRKAAAKLYCSSGCGCCRDDEGWDAASMAIGQLIGLPMYEDGSGYDFYTVMEELKDE